jgi:hypothetical protein
MIKTFSFEKENNRWYVVLPEYPGPKADLEMVMGADTLLDILAQGEHKTDVSISLSYIDDYDFELKFLREESGGGWYKAKSDMNSPFELWLCQVMFYVFGELPEIIYIL